MGGATQSTRIPYNTQSHNEVETYFILVYATHEPPKMAQFHWFAISGYLTIIPQARMGY